MSRELELIKYATQLENIIYTALAYDKEDGDYGVMVNTDKLDINTSITFSDVNDNMFADIKIYGVGFDEVVMLDDDEIHELLVDDPIESNQVYNKWIYPLIKLIGLLNGNYEFSVYVSNVRDFIKHLQLQSDNADLFDCNGKIIEY